MKEKIVIAGGTGFIGSRLGAHFVGRGYEVVVLTRGAQMEAVESPLKFVHWDGKTLSGWEVALDGAKAVINLAGENIGKGRWTTQKKERILQSRLRAGQALSEALERIKIRPPVFLQASAVGFYGHRGDEKLDESSPPGQGFLADVVRQWELSTKKLEQMGIRRVVLRTGQVFDRKEGVLPRFMLPFRFFLGGPLGSGHQWVSWIRSEDVVKAVDFLISCRDCQGICNLTAPEPVINRDLARTLGKVLKRPAIFPTPAFALKAAFGEKAEELLLSSQRVFPKRLLAAGFRFQFSHLTSALKDWF